ncbi:BTAD domain-containing putative transcriptional regulator [Kitasatospora sp. NPDC004669]|uniref:AfsR/SARP family transcriptional regulator n=1 Tax=Kitasatospora sp. NPDC004669 TaxID=3154555 RepID=UPI0033A954E4
MDHGQPCADGIAQPRVHSSAVPGSVLPCAWPEIRIGMLGGFALYVGGEPVSVPVSSERVLAFLALRRCRAPVPRCLIAGTLWPEAAEHCAFADLRAALCRLGGTGRRALEIGPAEVRLAPGTSVDLHRARSLARLLLDPNAPATAYDLGLAAVADLSADLLPGWYDDWLVLEADEWHQLRLHALEALADRLTACRRHGEAVAAAHAAIHADPLRESSHACLIRAHLAEGNRSEAVRDLRRYDQLLYRELGLHPTPRLHRLVAHAVASPSHHRHGRHAK